MKTETLIGLVCGLVLWCAAVTAQTVVDNKPVRSSKIESNKPATHDNKLKKLPHKFAIMQVDSTQYLKLRVLIRNVGGGTSPDMVVRSNIGFIKGSPPNWFNLYSWFVQKDPLGFQAPKQEWITAKGFVPPVAPGKAVWIDLNFPAAGASLEDLRVNWHKKVAGFPASERPKLKLGIETMIGIVSQYGPEATMLSECDVRFYIKFQ